MNITTFAQCMDVFDWYDDSLYDCLTHIMLAKLDGDERIQRTLPDLIQYANDLISAHKHTDAAYPMELLHQPA